MNVETTISSPAADERDVLITRLNSALGAEWCAAPRKSVARVPLRLDIMGGLADYTGSLILSHPLAAGVTVAVAPRQDQTVCTYAVTPVQNGAAKSYSWPLASFYGEGGQLASAAALAARFADVPIRCVRDVVAALYALLQRGVVEHFSGGLTVAVRNEIGDVTGAGTASATSAATVMATCNLLGVDLHPAAIADVVVTGQNMLWNQAQGIGEIASVLHATPGTVLEYCCVAQDRKGSFALPEGVEITGIDCGACAPNADEKYLHTRTATFMGRNIIARIVASNGAVVPAWRGQLSQLSITDYVECLRDRLPTKISGADFLSRFGPSGDTLTEIDSSAVYKVRSRTEHHIYENARSHQFVERMSRASRTRDRNALVESGEIMYASHWSYGQRCGLGSIETDRMVNLVRTRGLQSGIYGARISGRGAGGTVIILHEAADHSRQAIQQAMQEYAGGTGCRPTRLDRALTGSATWGVRIFE